MRRRDADGSAARWAAALSERLNKLKLIAVPDGLGPLQTGKRRRRYVWGASACATRLPMASSTRGSASKLGMLRNSDSPLRSM